MAYWTNTNIIIIILISQKIANLIIRLIEIK